MNSAELNKLEYEQLDILENMTIEIFKMAARAMNMLPRDDPRYARRFQAFQQIVLVLSKNLTIIGAAKCEVCQKEEARQRQLIRQQRLQERGEV